MDDVGYLTSYGGKSLHQQSHGESFMAVLTRKLRGNGFYIFDEPEAALSPLRLLAALAAIHDLVKKGSQFIIATHSPILMSYPEATIYEFSDTGVSEILYEETAHFSLTKYFLNNYKAMLKKIFEE
jgi:predicted ATPase